MIGGLIGGLIGTAVQAFRLSPSLPRFGLTLSADDPLGPVDEAPDVPRDLACDLTATDTVCSPPEPDPSDLDFDAPVDVAGAGAGFGAFGTLLVVLLVIVLVAAIAWIVISMLRNRTAIEEDADDLDEDLDDIADERIVDLGRPPDRWRRAATEHREAGRFRDAIRCEYRALVGDLARSGHVDEIPGRTSGEEREQVWSLAPGVAPSFEVAADIFDAAWFDDAVVTIDHHQRFVAASTAVLGDVLNGAGAQPARGRGRR